jgi:hypothetical protein
MRVVPEHQLAVVPGGSVARYRLFALNAQAGIPDRTA